MTFARLDHNADLDTLARLPTWVTSARVVILEDVAFLSGTALNHLHLVLRRNEEPQALLPDRMALRAAEACVAFSGRTERAKGHCQVVQPYWVGYRVAHENTRHNATP